jgi:hypothetical protein
MSSPVSGEPGADGDWYLGISQRDIALAEADLAEPEPAGYVCIPCQNDKCRSCRDVRCECCSAQP